MADVLQSDGTVRISGEIPLHYLVGDATGQVATIEFLQGRLHARSGESLPAPALANDTYDEAVEFWRKRRGQRPGGDSSHARFARAAEAVSRFDASGPAAVDRAFQILGDVAQRSTRWSIVYDQTGRTVRFRTDGHAPIRLLAFPELNFDCGAGARAVDVNAKLEGNIASAMEPFTDARNRALVEASYNDFPSTRQTPPREREQVVTQPFAARCGGEPLAS